MFGKKYFNNIYGLICANVILIISCYLYLPNIFLLFYVSVGITTFAYGLMIPSLNIINNQIGKLLKDELRSYLPLVLIMLTIVQSIARFCGPALFTLYAQLVENNRCNFDDKNKYIIDGCDIKHYIMGNSIIISICCLIIIISVYILRKTFNNLKYQQNEKQLLISQYNNINV